MSRTDPECVGIKHRAAAKIQARIAGMTLEEEVAYWAERSRFWAEEREAIRRRREEHKAGVPAG